MEGLAEENNSHLRFSDLLTYIDQCSRSVFLNYIVPQPPSALRFDFSTYFHGDYIFNFFFICLILKLF